MFVFYLEIKRLILIVFLSFYEKGCYYICWYGFKALTLSYFRTWSQNSKYYFFILVCAL